MALASRCPQCQATFRVVADQLKLRGGLVRCGSCRHVFDAIGGLIYVDDSGARTVSASVVPPPAAVPEARLAQSDSDAAALGVPTLLITDPPTRSRRPAPRAPTPASAAPPSDEADPSRRRSSPAAATAEAGPHVDLVPAGPDADAAALTRLGDESADDTADERGDAPPAFLQRPARSRGFSIVFGGGSLLLALVALLQLAVLLRVELASALPAVRPALVELCKPLNCTVGWPARAELLAVVGTELQAVAGTDILELTTVVRNRATHTLALPAIEVTLTDTQNRPLARKVFAPVDYLASAGEPGSRIDDGLAAGADYVVRLSFEARGLAAAGFVVYPFYL
jgi:predicted Zn finger-like uncharacterized protein